MEWVCIRKEPKLAYAFFKVEKWSFYSTWGSSFLDVRFEGGGEIGENSGLCTLVMMEIMDSRILYKSFHRQNSQASYPLP